MFVLYWGLSYDLSLKFLYQTLMLLTALEDKGWSLEEVLNFVMNWIFLGGSWKRRFNGDEMMNEGKGEVIQNIERVVEPLPLMTYGLKLSLKAWILKFKKKSFNNLRFNELQLNFGNSNFFVKLRYVICIFTNSRFKCKL